MHKYSNLHYLDAIDELMYKMEKKYEAEERNIAIEKERQAEKQKRLLERAWPPNYKSPYSTDGISISSSINAMPSTYIETPEDIQRRIDKRESDWLASLEREVQELEEREREEALQLEKERYFYSHWFIRWLLFIFKYKMNPKW